MKIERPDWKEITYGEFGCIPTLDLWFDKHIAPYEFYDPKDAVEVYGSKESWLNFDSRLHFNRTDTYKALLINIEPIKQETAVDVLRELIEWRPIQPGTFNSPKLAKLKEKAKKILEREGK